MLERQPTPILACAGLLVCMANATAAETAQELYQHRCIGCHGSGIHTRMGCKVGSAEELETQVRRCELGLGLNWFDEDVAKVADYLNQNFYHFKH
ncbi:c-type cytochrome [Imhoffiella purpurea]|uniref:Cytochrome c domain-containing protein n=1 Tax=Imhoffiella purpurea TaxID=1249627 RepID=W9VB38_9GAMM|nr:cytochrome c [Imhoffiella purpurea]EXJ14161.1 hypothetical protein D779_2832 [Imhoffiella purpurea]